MKTIDFLHGIVLLSLIPLRREAAEQSEMVTQLVFGDTFTVIDKNNDWLYIRNDYDNYEGWVNCKTITSIEEATYKEIRNSKSAVVSSFYAKVQEEGKAPIHIVQGSSLPNYDELSKTLTIGERTFHFTGDIAGNSTNKRADLVQNAKMYLNAPYLWGGKSAYGIDCSGFVQQLAKVIGIKIPRDASQQVLLGKDVSFLDNVEPGDIAFFDNEEGRIVHVGILLSKNIIIHASGYVRIDSIDQQGIYNLDLQSYTHHLRTIKNIID